MKYEFSDGMSSRIMKSEVESLAADVVFSGMDVWLAFSPAWGAVPAVYVSLSAWVSVSDAGVWSVFSMDVCSVAFCSASSLSLRPRFCGTGMMIPAAAAASKAAFSASSWALDLRPRFLWTGITIPIAAAAAAAASASIWIFVLRPFFFGSFGADSSEGVSAAFASSVDVG